MIGKSTQKHDLEAVQIKDTYKTLAANSFGEFKDRGSKFLAYAFPAKTTEEIQDHLLEVRKLHPKARHHCYAYRLGMDQSNFRANDDGEPSNTAGKPILGRIDSAGLTNTLIVVVRYFGGTLLGASGLINAYKKSAAHAIEQAVIKDGIVQDVFTISFDYGLMSQVMSGICKLPIKIVEQRFEASAAIDIAIRQSKVDDTLKHLKAIVAGVYLEEVDDLEEIKGFELKFLFRE